MKSFKDTAIGREFLAGKCYLRVTKEEWAEFVKWCDAAGMVYGGTGSKPANFPAIFNPDAFILVENGTKMWKTGRMPKNDEPIHPFSALCAEPEKPKYERGALYTINDAKGCQFSVGDVVLIDEEVHDRFPYCVRLSDGFRSPAALHRLMPYTEPDKPAQPAAPYDGRGKHKVGDRFVMTEERSTCYGLWRIGDVVELAYDDKSTCPKFRHVASGLDHYMHWHSMRPFIAPTTRKIIITTDGKTTTARLMEDKTTIRTATATCSPDDTFDFDKGARLAFDRLLPCKDRDKPTEAWKASVQQAICDVLKAMG